nr:hypothetical protein [Tanacetum cinerariifolium]
MLCLLSMKKGLPKKAATPQVLAIQGSGIYKPNKKPQAAKEKGKGCDLPLLQRGGHWRRKCLIYLAELMKNKKQVGSTSTLESATHILNMVPTKTVDKTPYELWYRKVSNLSYLKNLTFQEACGRAIELKEIQYKDTLPFENTSEHLVEAESLKPQIDVAPIRRSERTPRARDHLCLNVDVEEYSLRYLNEPNNYKAALSTPESGASTPEELRRMQKNLSEKHCTTMKNILKYSRNTKDVFLVYGENLKAELRVTCYCDAGFETNNDDIKSQTGYVFILNGGVVDWKSYKQSITAMFVTEAKYIDALEAAMEAVWIRKFIMGLALYPQISDL